MNKDTYLGRGQTTEGATRGDVPRERFRYDSGAREHACGQEERRDSTSNSQASPPGARAAEVIDKGNVTQRIHFHIRPGANKNVDNIY